MSNPLWKHTGWGPATYDSEWDENERAQLKALEAYSRGDNQVLRAYASAALRDKSKLNLFRQALYISKQVL